MEVAEIGPGNPRVASPFPKRCRHDVIELIWEYGQHWLPHVEPGFAPGRVGISWQNDDLIICAELEDAHVMMDEYPFNFPAYQQCDAFEIFLGPAGEAAYYEFHVTPSNSVLQLQFEGPGSRKSLSEHLVTGPLFVSETRLTSEGWNVHARIPLGRLFPKRPRDWLLSFGRYDYTPGQANPVISSTSPHAVCNFHRKD